MPRFSTERFGVRRFLPVGLSAVLCLTCRGPDSAAAAAITWVTDASGSWHTAANWSSNPALPGAGDAVTISRPAANPTITFSTGSTTIQSLTSDEALVLSGGILIVTTGASKTNASLSLSGNSQLTATGAATSFAASGTTTISAASVSALAGAQVDLSPVTSFTGSSSANSTLKADGAGSALDLSNVTTFVGGSTLGTRVAASAGGTVDLSNVSGVTSGAVDFNASGTGSLIKLNALTTFTPNNFADTNRIWAQTGATVEVPNLSTVGRATLAVQASGVLNLPTLSNANQASFLAEAGGTLTTPVGLTSYTGSSAYASTIQADGSGSKIDMSSLTSFAGGTSFGTRVFASNGGTVDLRNITSVTSGAVDFNATGTGSLIRLDALATFTPTNFSDSNRIGAQNSSTVEVPNLTTVGRATLLVSGAGVLNLPSLTSANQANLLAQSGGTLTTPSGLSSYTGSNDANSTLQAEGSGSKLNLSSITSLAGGSFFGTRVWAINGGSVDLHNLPAVTTGAVSFIADGATSKLNLSGLASYTATNLSDGHEIQATGGGQVTLHPVATTVNAVDVRIDSGGTIVTPKLTLGPDSTLTGNGTQTSDVQNSGTLSAGNVLAVGTLAIAGNLVETSAGTIRTEVAGTAQGTTLDQLTVTGATTLAGEMELAVISGHVPTLGTSYTLLESGSISGFFNTVDGIVTPTGLYFAVLASATKVEALVVKGGDASLNNAVDGGDYTLWADNYLTNNLAYYTKGDFNGDGITDGADYTIWADHYEGAPALAYATPEPCTAALAGLGLVLLAARALAARWYRPA